MHEWIGQREILNTTAGLLVGFVDEQDLPLSPRLVGRAWDWHRRRWRWRLLGCAIRSCMFFSVHGRTRVRRICGNAGAQSRWQDRLSCVTAGDCDAAGWCLRLGRRQPHDEKSWASWLRCMDQRRYVESIVAGIVLHAHPRFPLCGN